MNRKGRFVSCLLVLVFSLCLFQGASAVEYRALCGHLYSAVKNCGSTGCLGKMRVENICQYSFFSIPVPAGTTYLKLSFRNKVLYHRASCRQVKVVVRMDNDYLDQTDVKYRREVFLDELADGNTYLLTDDRKVYVTFREALFGGHTLYVGVLTHVDEMDVTIELPTSSIGRFSCYGDDRGALSLACTGEEECGEGNSVSEESAYTQARDFFWSYIRLKCMPGNLSKCEDVYDCEDAGGYWVAGACVEELPLAGESVSKCGYLCVSSAKDVYAMGDEVLLVASIPKYDKKVDVYMALVFPDGSLKILQQEEDSTGLADIEELPEIPPYAVGLSGPANLEVKLPTQVELFNGDVMHLLYPGEYRAYLLVVPEGSELASGDYFLTYTDFSVEGG